MEGSDPATSKQGLSNPVAVSGDAVPTPTLPSLVIRIFSAAVSDAPVANTSSVELLSAAKVASASAQIDAPTNIASVPAESNGA